MGITAGIVVAILLVIYYFRQHFGVPTEWQEFIIHGPATATEGELTTPAEAGEVKASPGAK
jgi:hypothetical protein